jgi:hypothetical protein
MTLLPISCREIGPLKNSCGNTKAGIVSLGVLMTCLLGAFGNQQAAKAEEPVSLRYHFKVGESLLYGMGLQQHLEISTDMVPGLTQKMDTRMDVELAKKVTGVSSGTATLDIGFRKFEAEMNLGGQKASVPGLEDARKIHLTLQMSERGESSDAKLLDPEELGDQTRKVAQTMVKSMTQNTLVFPEQPIAIGDSWTSDQELPADIPGAPEMKRLMKSTYKLVGIETTGGKRLAKISAEVAISLHGSGLQLGVPLQADLEGKGQGENLFDLQEGRVQSSKVTVNLEGDIKTSTQGENNSSHLKIDMTVDLKIKN